MSNEESIVATLADFRETTAIAMTPAKPSMTSRLGGMSDRAIAWLQSIPQRFLPPDVQKDPSFAALQGRADFQALFKRP